MAKTYKELMQLNSKNKNKHKNKQTNKRQQSNVIKKWAEDLTFFQRRHTNGQQLYEKMLNITNHQRNAN